MLRSYGVLGSVGRGMWPTRMSEKGNNMIFVK